jgi:hypothetical protein
VDAIRQPEEWGRSQAKGMSFLSAVVIAVSEYFKLA